MMRTRINDMECKLKQSTKIIGLPLNFHTLPKNKKESNEHKTGSI